MILVYKCLVAQQVEHHTRVVKFVGLIPTFKSQDLYTSVICLII